MIAWIFFALFVLGVLLVIAAMAPSGLGALLVAGAFLYVVITTVSSLGS